MRKILLTLFLSLALYAFTNAQTYCTAVNGGTSCITNVTFNTSLNHTTAGCENSASDYYTSVPVGTATTSITGGQSYSLSVTTNGAAIISVWIDYDHNGVFDSVEWNQVATSSTTSIASTITVAVPANAVAGQTGMRVRSRSTGSDNGPSDACTDMFSGETQDYVVTIVAAPACTGTPTAGTASASASVCSGVSFNLTLTGYTPGVSGLTFQWQSSSSLGGTYTNIAGATSPVVSVSQTATTYYKCVVTCSGSSSSSNVVTVTMNSPTNCYCTPPSTTCSSNDVITNVTMGTINNTTTCGTNGYSTYPTPVATFYKGLSYPVSVTVGSGGTEHVGIWIDYNQNGTYETTEFTSIGSGNGVTVSSNITIPNTAMTGNTMMRVRIRYNTALTGADACISYSYGETEDYAVNIGTAAACSGTPTAGTASASSDTVCSENFDLMVTGYTSGVSGLTFQWQWSATGTAGSYADIAGATSPTYTATQTATTYYVCVVTCSGSSATSSSVTVYSTPYMDCYCTSTATSTADEDIFNVTLGTLNNSSTCLTTGGTGSVLNKYSDYTAVTAPNLAVGTSASFSVQIGTCGTGSYKNAIKIYIDYNRNGSYTDAGEKVYASDTASGARTITGSFMVPSGLTNGNTMMRVVCRETSDTSTISSCGTYSWGETEDYKVNITGGSGVGIEENSDLNSVVIYPNPTAGVFNVAVNGAKFNEIAINIIDMQGKVVYSASDKNASENYTKQINLNGLAKGIYYVKLNTEIGVKVQKLIIQ